MSDFVAHNADQGTTHRTHRTTRAKRPIISAHTMMEIHREHNRNKSATNDNKEVTFYSDPLRSQSSHSGYLGDSSTDQEEPDTDTSGYIKQSPQDPPLGQHLHPASQGDSPSSHPQGGTLQQEHQEHHSGQKTEEVTTTKECCTHDVAFCLKCLCECCVCLSYCACWLCMANQGR